VTSNENGLGLFDDAASAVGNFPSALRGYDRAAVDDYVRSLEGAVVSTRRRAAALEDQTRTLQEQLSASIERQREQEIDFSNLGSRATEILRLAEEQSREMLDRATEDAERIKESARREADQMRAEAERAGTEITSNGIAEIEQLRVRGQNDVREQVEQARAEAERIIAAARREAEAVQRAAEHEAQTVRQNAYLDTEKLRREVEREVADVRQGIAAEREAAIGHLRGVHEDAVAKTSALLAEATEHHHQATERLDQDIAEAARIRAEALAAAEQIKLTAAKEAEERIVAARKQAAAITDRTQQEFAWRKQQLRRETDLLGQRKQAVLNQLASLSALAEQTVHAFPDIEDLDEFDAEQGDRTVMMPPSAPPTMPRSGDRPPAPSTAPEQDHNLSGSGKADGGTAGGSSDDESATETRVFQPVTDSDDTIERSARARTDGSSERSPVEQSPGNDPSGNDSSGNDTEDTMEIDGDATVMVPPAQLPAGTAQLHRGTDSKG